MQTATPTAPPDRLILLDSLRGFALAGVLLANLTAFSLYFFLPGDAALALPLPLANRLLDPIIGVLVTSKFITLFSLMFGIGFALQMGKPNDPSAARRYLRRLLWLLAFGIAHAGLLWWGDVLRYYAVIGLCLLAARRIPPRWLVIGALVLMLSIHPLLPVLGNWPGIQTEAQANAAALAAFSGDRFDRFLAGNRVFTDWWLFAHWTKIVWIAGCMAIGTALGKLGALQAPERYRALWRRLAFIALPAGVAASLLLELSYYGKVPGLSHLQASVLGGICLRLISGATVLVLALGYMGGFVVLFGSPAWRGRLAVLAPVGRMALSNYLTHTVVGIALFYGVGLGLGPRCGLAGVVLTWLSLFGAQIVLSHWWLARFRFGPAEWLWRSLTYGRRQPMRLAREVPASNVTASAR